MMQFIMDLLLLLQLQLQFYNNLHCVNFNFILLYACVKICEFIIIYRMIKECASAPNKNVSLTIMLLMNVKMMMKMLLAYALNQMEK